MSKGMFLKAAGGAAAAAALVAAVPALAANHNSSSSSSTTTSQSARPHLRHNGYAPGANGEKVLTGATLSSASSAALAAVPGGKVTRPSTETDGTISGAAYEVHVTKSGGGQAVVIENSSFKVLSVQSGAGHCAGGPGGAGTRGATDYGVPQGGQFQGANFQGGPPAGGPNI
jgi:hypothetical protein